MTKLTAGFAKALEEQHVCYRGVRVAAAMPLAFGGTAACDLGTGGCRECVRVCVCVCACV